MTWWALDVQTAAASRDAVASWPGQDRPGGRGAQRDGRGVCAVRSLARTAEHELTGVFPSSASRCGMEPVDWSTTGARDRIAAAGPLTFRPPGSKARGEISITLDPKWRWLRRARVDSRSAGAARSLHPADDRVLDLGTGSGIRHRGGEARGPARGGHRDRRRSAAGGRRQRRAERCTAR